MLNAQCMKNEPAIPSQNQRAWNHFSFYVSFEGPILQALATSAVGDEEKE
jgi:hypothetical protein